MLMNIDETGITFVNTIIGRGIYNNIVNLTLGAFQWTPSDDGVVKPDLVITARLRMDIPCAKELHRHLSELLETIERSAKANGAAANEDTPPTKEETLN